MILWALDLATNIGEAWGEPSALPALRHERLPSTGVDIGRFGAAARKWMMARLDEVCPNLIVFEMPVLPKPRFDKKLRRFVGGTSLDTTRKLHGLAFLVETIAYEEGIECKECPTQEAKKAITGRGNAKKQDVVRACRDLGLDPYTYQQDGEAASDEADAAAVFCRTVKVRWPHHAGIWVQPIGGTPLFSGPAA